MSLQYYFLYSIQAQLYVNRTDCSMPDLNSDSQSTTNSVTEGATNDK